MYWITIVHYIPYYKVVEKNLKEKFNNCETLQIELWYGIYIDNRKFVEEYKPKINENLFYNTQNSMIEFFKKLKEIKKEGRI